MAIIESARTRLRRFTEADLLHLVQLESEPDIMKFTPARVPRSLEQSQERLRKILDNEALHAPLGVWAGELKTGEFFGWFMLLKTPLEFPELGFMTLKKYWGLGFTPEAARGLMDHFNLPGISARTLPGNARSIRVLEKLGFVYEGNIPGADGVTELKLYRRDGTPP